MSAFLRPPVPVVLQQHLDDAQGLHATRSVLVRAPHVRLHQLQRLDERLAASLDGLAVAGDHARARCVAALENPTPGSVFVAAVVAIEGRDAGLTGRLLALAEALPEARAGLVSAFDWVPAGSLRGIIKSLIDSPSLLHREIGWTTCVLHGVEPGTSMDTAVQDAATPARVLRLAARCGRTDLLPALLKLLEDADPERVVEAACAALLLGDRQAAPQALSALGRTPGVLDDAAVGLLVRSQPMEQTHALLRALSQDAARVRTLIRATGMGGDPHHVPWLIKQMSDAKLARLAGESFSLVTGLDLAQLDLDGAAFENGRGGPSDAQEDDDVAMDEDDGLPWPDPQRIAAWWQSNGHRFTAGVRHFMGEPPSTAHCLSVLRGGFQRQRLAAAEYLCLLNPGTPLFHAGAPAWRQQRLLARMAG
jgi:uncharacterized protein (TIGR02270 family)